MFSMLSGQTNRIRWESYERKVSDWLFWLLYLWCGVPWESDDQLLALVKHCRLWAVEIFLDRVWVWLNWIRMHGVGGVKIILLNCLTVFEIVNRPVHPHNHRGKCKYIKTALRERLELHCILPRYPDKFSCSFCLKSSQDRVERDKYKNVIWIA